MLCLAVGSSCNVCIESDARRAALWRYAPGGSGGALYAGGLRNSALFTTDNGRDLLGDDFPPCELNLVEEGGFYGWPFVNGFGVLDPDYGERDEANVSGA
jgi:glucose/arabinose dehydrogenase